MAEAVLPGLREDREAMRPGWHLDASHGSSWRRDLGTDRVLPCRCRIPGQQDLKDKAHEVTDKADEVLGDNSPAAG